MSPDPSLSQCQSDFMIVEIRQFLGLIYDLNVGFGQEPAKIDIQESSASSCLAEFASKPVSHTIRATNLSL